MSADKSGTAKVDIPELGIEEGDYLAWYAEKPGTIFLVKEIPLSDLKVELARLGLAADLLRSFVPKPRRHPAEGRHQRGPIRLVKS